MTTKWRANVGIATWLLLFALTLFTSRVPYVAPLSFVVVVLIAWDYGLRSAVAWILLAHVLIPIALLLLGIGPFFVFVEAPALVAMIMGATLLTVIGLAYLTDRVHSLTSELQNSKSSLQQVNEKLQMALNEVKELRGLLRICAWCKHVTDDNGKWEELETYISTHSRARFTHGVCPQCYEEQIRSIKTRT